MTYLIPKKFRDDDGNASIEFVVIFPIFIIMFMSVIEMGLLMTRYMMFERGLDITVREMRLDTNATYTKEGVRGAICDETLIVANCKNSLTLELTRLDSNDDQWSFPGTKAVCTNTSQEIEPLTKFRPGLSHDTMYVRACLNIKPMFPWAALGANLAKDNTGAFNMIAQSAFAVEPL
jgi:hypothetical protein